ncbi:unnamed protein product [Soboliphyme baturini]|uniref:U6 snRNA-associated Sm-like protein LSm1 n=1 Tax=Soboliphyme baturini TaxID=241478 RepID=A0A183J6T4_9BILA|nr:unnamed protein product [Soboliphyme baturini]
MLIVLRDGRTLIGYLRSVDQFANLVLSHTIERIHVGQLYGDIPRGVFVIRGENVVLLGEIVRADVEKDRQVDLKQVSVEEILEFQRRQQEEKDRLANIRKNAFKERGLAPSTDIWQEELY